MRDVLEEWRPVVDEAIEEFLPRVVDEAYLSEFFGPASHAYDPEAIQVALSDPIWELLDRGGKRWRAVLFLLLVEAFGEDPEEFLPYACIPEILHNGTIVVDDVEDGAEMRRGERAIHHEFGTDIALNAGNAMYFLPLKIITHDPGDLDTETRLAAYEMLMYELNRTHLGQGMDITWHNQREIDITEEQYLEMSACKTGCLGRIVARLAAIVTGQSETTEEAVADYAERMSIAFQIGDDILDIEHSRDGAGEFGKAFGNDIREGKKTLVAIYTVGEADPEDAARLEEILWADDTTDEQIEWVLDLYRSTGSVEYARERALSLSERARTDLDGLDLDPESAAKLADFTRFVVERDA